MQHASIVIKLKSSVFLFCFFLAHLEQTFYILQIHEFHIFILSTYILHIWKLWEIRIFLIRELQNRWFTFMERNERVQSTEDLSQFTLCHDV